MNTPRPTAPPATVMARDVAGGTIVVKCTYCRHLHTHGWRPGQIVPANCGRGAGYRLPGHVAEVSGT